MRRSKLALNGVLWSAIEKFSVQGIQFVISVILARLLVPADFGLIALVLVVMNILQTINEVGFGAALMQKKTRDDLDFSTVFILNTCLGVFLYGILLVMAPYIASFFEQPRLSLLIRVIGINLISTSLVVVQRTRLLIEVDFKTQARASLVAVILSGVGGILLAYYGGGVWALVLQSILYNLTNTVLIWAYVSWRPRMRFSYDRFVALFNFAYKLIFARLINSVFQEVFSAVVGKLYTPAQLGYFNRAKSFEALSTNNITMIVQRVSVPILCEVQNDKDDMKQVLLRFIRSTALIVYPLLFGLAILAEPLISVLLTDKWLPSAWILRVLCPVGIFFVISTFNMNVFNATGRTDWALKCEIIKKIFCIGIILFTSFWGFKALVWSQVVIAFVEFLINTYYTKRQIGLTMWEQLVALKGVLLACIAMVIVLMICDSLIGEDWILLLVGIGMGAIFYAFVCYVFNIASFKLVLKNLLKK